MGGVDMSYALLAYYQVKHKNRKWYKTFFYHFVDITILNSFILHKEMTKLPEEKSLTQKLFRETLQLELLELSKQSVSSALSSTLPKPTMCMPDFYSAANATSRRSGCELYKRLEKKKVNCHILHEVQCVIVPSSRTQLF